MITILEEEDTVLDADVFIQAPENHLISDGDSDGADPEANHNHLSGNQLRGNA